MESIYREKLNVRASMCDSSARLGIADTFALFMDIATEHASLLQISGAQLLPKGLFWLTAKTRVRFLRRPAMSEPVEALTWPEDPELPRCYRDYQIRQGDEILAEGKTEWAVLQMATGRLKKASEIFPEGLEIHSEVLLPEGFRKIPEDFGEEDCIGTYTVRSTDIDLGGHMNNVAYIRAVQSMYSARDWQALDIREAEVWYRNQCYEGDILQVYRREEPDGELHFQLTKPDGSTALLMRIIRKTS